MLLLTTVIINPNNTIYSQAMLDHEVNAIEKEDRKYYVVDDVVVPEKI